MSLDVLMASSQTQTVEYNNIYIFFFFFFFFSNSAPELYPYGRSSRGDLTRNNKKMNIAPFAYRGQYRRGICRDP